MTGSTDNGLTDKGQITKIGVFPWMEEPAVEAVMSALADARGEPRFVGGCVRDTVLGRPIQDIDVATVLTPEAVQSALRNALIKSVPTGIDHGTVTAVVLERMIEVTTLRRDVETDGRHAQVAFTDNWLEDAARRDFTMNALSLSQDGEMFDFFDGQQDAKAGRVRFVGQPVDRIKEDYLRILRYFRFLAHYGHGDPDSEAIAACRVGAPGLQSLSGERLSKEYFRLLEAPNPEQSLRFMEASGCLFPFGVGPFGIDRLAALPLTAQDDPLLRFMALLSDDSNVATMAIERLKFSNTAVDRILAARNGFDFDGPSIQEQLYRKGAQAVRDAAMLFQAEGRTEPALHDAVEAAHIWTMPKFPVKGQDLLDRGVQPGPVIGTILKAVETWWIEQDFQPEREACLKKAQSLIP